MEGIDISKINPFDFDNKISQFKDYLQKTGAPQDQSDELIKQIKSKYQEENSGGGSSSGVLGTGFGSNSINESTASQGETPDMYREAEANSGFVLSPLRPGQNQLMGVPKLLPNTLSDTGNVAAGIATALTHPIKTIEDIYKNPVMLGGPVVQTALNTSGSILTDIFQGNISKVGVDLLSGLDKSWTGFVDHPILSLPIIGAVSHLADIGRDLTDVAGVTKPKVEIDPATGQPKPKVTLKSDVAGKMDTFKKSFEDPKATAINIAKAFVAPFKSLMPNATGDAAANIIADRVKTTLTQINNIDSANALIDSKPDFKKQISENENALKVLEVNKTQAGTDLESAHQEDTALAKGLSSTLAPNTPELIQETLKGKIDTIKTNYTGNYENLKSPDGLRIPLRNTAPLVNDFKKFQDDNGAVLDPKTNGILSKYNFLLDAQQMISEGKSIKDVTEMAAKENKTDILNQLPPNIFKMPLSADQIKIMRDTIVESIKDNLPRGSAMNYVKIFGDTTKGSFNQMLDDSVNPVNPHGADAVRSANTAFSKLEVLKEKYGLEDDGSFSSKKIETNFEQLKKDFPEAAKAYGQMKANDVFVFKTSDTGVESLDYVKTDKNLEAAKQFIPSTTYSQVKAIISKGYTDNSLFDQLNEKITQLSDNLGKNIEEAKTNEKISPTNSEDFESKVMNIKKSSDLNDLSKTSRLSKSDIGKIFIAKSLEKNFGTDDLSALSTDKIIEGTKGFLKDFDSVGGLSTTKAIKSDMLNDYVDTMENLRKEIDRAEMAKKEGGREIAKNTGIAVGASIISKIHPILGTMTVIRAVRNILKGKISEPREGLDATVSSRIAEGIKNQAKNTIKGKPGASVKTGTAAGNIYSYQQYQDAAEKVVGRKLTSDEQVQLKDQYDKNNSK